MAHLLEHLLFKGTPKHAATCWAEFTKRGLRANGTTWFDRTNYFASFAANDDNLRWYLAWQADAMVNSFIAREDLDTEMTVVRNEMERGENNPSRILLQRTLASMYDWHNYGKSTIGARTDVENVDIARLQAFYRRYYQPDNATLIVAGKFDRGAGAAPGSPSHFGADPQARRARCRRTTRSTRRRTASAASRCAASAARRCVMAGYHVPPGAHRRLRRGRAAGAGPRRHARRAGCTSAWSKAAWRPRARSASPSALAEPGARCSSVPQLAPGQDVDTARAELLATVESLRARAGHRRGARARAGAVAQGLGAGLHQPGARRRGAVRGDRAGRLAAVLPDPRPRARGHARRRAARRDAVPAAVEPHARHLPADRASRSARRRRRASTSRRCQGLQAAGGAAGRGLRRHAGQHRRAHAALRRSPAA